MLRILNLLHRRLGLNFRHPSRRLEGLTFSGFTANLSSKEQATSIFSGEEMMTHASVHGCGNLFFEFDPDEFAYLLRKLEDKEYVSQGDIARVRAANPGRTLPLEVLIFEKDRAAGKIKRPGRRKLNNVFEVMMPGLAFWHYEWLHARLRRRKETVGLNGWSATMGKSWWAGTPSERALKMTLCWLDKRGLARNVSERRLANIISQQRQKIQKFGSPT